MDLTQWIQATKGLAIVVHPAPWACDFRELPTVLPLLVRGFPNQIRSHCLLGSIVVKLTNLLNPFVFIYLHVGPFVSTSCSLSDNAADSVMSFHN
jgi:hypothetical protein